MSDSSISSTKPKYNYDLIYDAPDVAVKYRRGTSGKLIITFSPATGRRAERRDGFGQGVFERYHFSTMFLIAKWDHWWQGAECAAAVAFARQIIERDRPSSVCTYGTSMGAYGAALFSSALQADTSIMFAPQWTIDPSRTPFERRWARDAAAITFTNDDMQAAVSPITRKYVVFDPLYRQDKLHADLYLELPNAIRVGIPLSGHTPAFMLRETGILRRIVMEMADGTFDGMQCRALIRKGRGESPLYWSRVADIARKRPSRMSLAELAANRARTIAPDSSTYASVYLKIAFARGQYEMVFEEASKAVIRWPKIFALWRHLTNAAMETGRVLEALQAARRAFEISKKPDAYGLLVRALELSHHQEEARAVFTEAFQRYPTDVWLARNHMRFLLDDNPAAKGAAT